MTTEAGFVLAVFTMAIWIIVSREAVKPTKEINWRKMKTLLMTGTLTTTILTIGLFQNFLF